ncbi:class I SAM-dependent RNA methyltransferase [Tropicimonas sp. TH_r6]|uniref:class I SAM-dependent RNA methyltransferase n=1 Tax=Tropicimonas sp. TH_r6 TaxID=3082085 RepID=UPI002953C1A3|nr:class I SAM-dependent RNA methyltransferase [Tropicimonas sp. TH_r6]MDV7141257.1 class I SAM-dependent RNA methyltransferase [Tropicimonas sp. TH_r6]
MNGQVVERLGHLGDGILDGPVFAARCLPGEVIDGETVDGRIAAPRILEPSPHRVSPPCRHYKSCGGCAVQHASDAFVAEWKTGIVRTALEAQGLETEFRPVHISPPKSRRRAVFSGRRTKKDVLIGFHARASETLIEVPDCQLLRPELLATHPALAEMTRVGASRKAELSFTVTLTEEGPEIAVEGGKPLDLPLRAALGAIAEEHELARLNWGDEQVAQRARPLVRFEGISVEPPPGAFLQATEDGEATLRDAVREIVEDAGRIADLFSGCGTFALPLAKQAEIHAVEGMDALTHALAAGWRNATGLKQVTVETRDLFRRPLLPDELAKFDAIVIDPPRAGAQAQCAEIARSKVERVAFVSCNPVTFARDAALLVQAGFHLEWLLPVDQFRWSTHVELAACFSRNHIGA